MEPCSSAARGHLRERRVDEFVGQAGKRKDSIAWISTSCVTKLPEQLEDRMPVPSYSRRHVDCTESNLVDLGMARELPQHDETADKPFPADQG